MLTINIIVQCDVVGCPEHFTARNLTGYASNHKARTGLIQYAPKGWLIKGCNSPRKVRDFCPTHALEYK